MMIIIRCVFSLMQKRIISNKKSRHPVETHVAGPYQLIHTLRYTLRDKERAKA